ncbi:MAG: sugar transferase [Candidatus Methylumidiphilus sp.]
MYLITKRIFDIVVSLIMLLVLAPILIPIVIALKLSGEGCIWYFQERVGYKNSTFSIYKFATMLKDSPNMSTGIITTIGDPRITPMGGILRKTKINELPQLLNILLGDMSFVGPRPVMRISFEAYPAEIQAVIYNIKPGLTGVGSIVFRDEEELITKKMNAGEDTWNFYTNKIYPHKGELENWYQNHLSFITDVKLMLLTALVVIFPKNTLIYKWFPSLPVRGF